MTELSHVPSAPWNFVECLMYCKCGIMVAWMYLFLNNFEHVESSDITDLFLILRDCPYLHIGVLQTNICLILCQCTASVIDS